MTCVFRLKVENKKKYFQPEFSLSKSISLQRALF